MQARQLVRRKRKELGQEPPRGYVLSDAFRLWCNLKRGRITSYMDEKRRHRWRLDRRRAAID